MFATKLVIALVVAVSPVACSGTPTGPSSPAPHAAVAAQSQDVHFECSEENGWMVCYDTDPQPPPPPPAPEIAPCGGIVIAGVCDEFP